MYSNRVYYAIYILAAFCVWPFVNVYVNNPDSFQYIAVARHLSEFRLQESINGYWSPLLSWALAPLLLTGIHPLFLFKGLNLFFGLLALSAWCRLMDGTQLQGGFSRLLRVAAVPMLLSQALLTLTADLLFVAVSLGMLAFFMSQPVWNNSRRSLAAGGIGALLFFSKSFGLPLFIAFSIITFLHHRRTVTGATRKNLFLSFSVLALLCGSWILALSLKYGHPTVSEAARYNFTQEVIGQPGKVVYLPILYDDGLTRPANSHALSAWEEPMLAKSLTVLHPFENPDDLTLWVSNIKRNFLSMWYFDFQRQAGMFFLLMIGLALLLKSSPSWNNPRFVYPLVLLTALYVGYGLILYHARYSWLCTYLMLFLSALLLQRIRSARVHRIQAFLLVTMILFAVKRPVKEFLFGIDKDVTLSQLGSASLDPVGTMTSTFADDARVFRASESIRCIDGPFASRYSTDNHRPRYFSSLLLADRLNQPYFGQINDAREGAMDEIRKMGVRYFVVWDNDTNPINGLLPVFSLEGVRVYRLK